MNYRHAFHAGNFADVHKHLVLLALLARLQRKPKPLFYMDTHAGRGWYDLSSADARRGAEWKTGIARLSGLDSDHEDLRRYLEAAGLSERREPTRYPGSPILAIRSLRPIDRAVLVERQIAEAQALEQSVRRERRVSIVCGDGYAALKTFLPPRENRGLVLIDPPYEADREFEAARRALEFGLTRWPNGLFALWYPIKAGAEAERLEASLKASGFPRLLALELSVYPADSPVGLNGSGLVLANPPWKFDTELAPALEAVRAALAPKDGVVRIEWLAGE